MGDVVRLTFGRARRGKKLPKPVLCKDCDDPIETARLQAVPGARRCIACEGGLERRIEREMSAVREHQAVKIIR
jgi:hypothetical protein